MDESRRSRVPYGFLGMIAIVVLVEVLLARRPIAISTVASWNRQFSAESASLRSPGHDVLFFGDSLIKLGLVPKIIEDDSGQSAFNLAAASSPAPSTYVMLRRALDAGAKPKAIIIDFGPGLLAAAPDKDIRNASEVLRLGEFLDLAMISRSVPYASSFALRWVLPTVRRRSEIRKAIVSAWRGEIGHDLETNRACLRNWLQNDGAHLAAVSTTASPDSGSDTTSAGQLHVHRVNREYVDRIFAMAASKGIRAYWLLPPTNPQSPRQGLETSYTAFVKSVKAKHPEITILDARHSGYDASVFFDPVHLDVRGAVALSRSIARAISDPSDKSPKWIALAKPEFSPGQRLPEDFEQSKIAVVAEHFRAGRVIMSTRK